MNKMTSYLKNLKYKRIGISFPLRIFFGKYPLLFYFLYGLVSKNRMLSVNRNTQLVIERFPKSANTFAVVSLQNAQSVKLQLAHHMHVPELEESQYYQLLTVAEKIYSEFLS
jgi:hypothetical protein